VGKYNRAVVTPNFILRNNAQPQTAGWRPDSAVSGGGLEYLCYPAHCRPEADCWCSAFGLGWRRYGCLSHSAACERRRETLKRNRSSRLNSDRGWGVMVACRRLPARACVFDAVQPLGMPASLRLYVVVVNAADFRTPKPHQSCSYRAAALLLARVDRADNHGDGLVLIGTLFWAPHVSGGLDH
jgi:hypothetical protein